VLRLFLFGAQAEPPPPWATHVADWSAVRLRLPRSVSRDTRVARVR
jgi:hypothetical protein